MIDFTKPVQTRDGRKARILATDLDHETYSVAAAITYGDGRESVEVFTPDGGWYANFDGHHHNRDLVNTPEKRTTYLHLYRNSDGSLIHFDGGSSKIAREKLPGGCVGRIKVVLEEGRFDE